MAGTFLHSQECGNEDGGGVDVEWFNRPRPESEVLRSLLGIGSEVRITNAYAKTPNRLKQRREAKARKVRELARPRLTGWESC